MTETLTGKQVLALLAQDDVPEIECTSGALWTDFNQIMWSIPTLRGTTVNFRIKPTPPRRLSVTLSNGEVVSWSEPVREELKDGQEYWYVDNDSEVIQMRWEDESIVAKDRITFGNVHLTREAAQEHADALRRINCQGVGK